MEIWEIVKSLSENPSLKFKNKRTKSVLSLMATEEVTSVMRLCVKCDSGVEREWTITFPKKDSPGCGNIKDEWELVQESVDFMTAVKAFNEGKVISCEYESVIDGSIRRETFKPVGETNAMSRDDRLTFYVIGKGRWFIE